MLGTLILEALPCLGVERGGEFVVEIAVERISNTEGKGKELKMVDYL